VDSNAISEDLGQANIEGNAISIEKTYPMFINSILLLSVSFEVAYFNAA
jgi:hypothetical protein